MARTLPAHLQGVDLREAILDAADSFLAEEGYSSFTMDQLASRVGIGKGTTYLNFSSKEEVALAVIARVVRRVMDRLEGIAASPTSPARRLEAMLIGRVLLRHEGFSHYRSHFVELLGPLRAQLQELRHEHSHVEARAFARLIEEGVASGDFEQCDPLPTAHALLIATEALLPSHLTAAELHDKRRLRAQTKRVAELLVRGLEAKGQSHSRRRGRSTRRLATAAASVAALLLFDPSRSSAQTDATIVAGIDSALARYDSASPGCAVSVSRAGQVIAEKARGLASIELRAPNTPATVFNAGSIAKQFTALSTLMLMRDGKLSLDDPVRKYVPELPSYGSAVLIRHLLEHTSGIRDQGELLWIAGGRDDARYTRETMLDLLATQKSLNFMPGTEFSYSNTEYDLLALIIERVSGAPLRDFANERIFKPLGMAHTEFRNDAGEVIAGRASGYRPARAGAWRLGASLSDVYGGGELFTTTGDLLRWERNFGNPVVGDRAIVELMQTEVKPRGQPTGFGLGLTVSTYRGARVIGHEGRTFGYQSDVERFPDLDLAIAVLCNGRDIDAYTIARQIVAPLVSTSAAGSPAVQSAAITPGSPSHPLESYTGIYFNPSTLAVRRVVVRSGKLVWARGEGTELIPVGGDVFQLSGSPVQMRFAFISGSKPSLTVTQSGRISTYARMESFTGDTREYSGQYDGAELATTYSVSAHDSTITLRVNADFSVDARPVFKDGFAIADGVIVRFQRSGSGAISGMTLSTSRARNVLFTRRGSGRGVAGSADHLIRQSLDQRQQSFHRGGTKPNSRVSLNE
jgi:CubicO group peptidase (beta-lactamase class C family)